MTIALPRITLSHMALGVLLVAGLALGLLLGDHGSAIQIIKNATGQNSSEGMGKLLGIVARLQKPLVVAVIAIVPLALIAGAGALAVGSRKGVMIMGGAVAGAVLAACASGLAA